MTQLAFDLEALGLALEPTAAMRDGRQEVYQHSHCGTVVVRTDLARATADLGRCPSCDHPDAPWWQQQITPGGRLAGLRSVAPEPGGSEL